MGIPLPALDIRHRRRKRCSRRGTAGNARAGSSAAGPGTSNRPAGYTHSARDAPMRNPLFDIRAIMC
jgi:hypothetical protein